MAKLQQLHHYLGALCFFLLICLHPYHLIDAKEQTMHKHIATINLQEAGTIPITLEFAKKPNEISWGLMLRPSLPADRGMLFFFNKPSTMNFWSFNSLIDLSIAFIDKEQVIRDLKELKSYPEKMDPARPVHSIADFKLYPANDPVTVFFQMQSVGSAIRISYALEMNKQWFPENGVIPGDVLLWDETASTGTIIHTLDIGKYISADNQPAILRYDKSSYLSVWMPNETQHHDIAFLNKDNEVIQIGNLYPGKNLTVDKVPVMHSKAQAQAILIAPEGWLMRNNIGLGTKLVNPE
jgi:uncharacterized protein